MRMLTLVAATAILFSASPAVFAAMPGQDCSSVGASQMSDDRQHIVACLLTNDPNRPPVWKSSTSGGSGITGGCSFDPYTGGGQNYNYYKTWGRGCYVHQDRTIVMNRGTEGYEEALEENRQAIASALFGPLMEEPGYSCGVASIFSDQGTIPAFFLCVKEQN